MTKTFTLKDLVMYESENKQRIKSKEDDQINLSPSTEIVNYILAYAQALNVTNNRYTGPVFLILN